MSTIFTSPFASYWLAFVCLAIMVCIVMLAVQNKRLASRIKEQSSHILAQQKELSMVSSASVGMGQRLSELQVKLNNLSNGNQDKNAPESDVAYARALRLLDNNADETTIMANSGLSQSEIRLMQLVNRPKESV